MKTLKVIKHPFTLVIVLIIIAECFVVQNLYTSVVAILFGIVAVAHVVFGYFIKHKCSGCTPVNSVLSEAPAANVFEEQLKAAQQQLITQEKMASIGMLTAGIAHEIKNPLNFVNNFSDMTVELVEELKEEIAKIENMSDAQKESIDGIVEDIGTNCRKINEHGKRAESIIKNMLIQTRASNVDKVPIDINQLLEEYLNLAYHGLRAQNNKFNAKMEKQLDTTLPKITASAQSIGRVFLNIINNGLYAANKKSEQFSSELLNTIFMPTISISSSQDNDNIIIKIKDNGNGIKENVIAKIFEPFFTTKPAGEGTGLGLPICYDIVTKEHGGKLDVVSKVGEFTEFIITIPKDKLN
ncbi:MAG TPA: HAMP domain-containing sensor histidine kinase [Candidatus Berkiella sp.]|nr:HAMP domain-containing sensor histidine kinase [Candidatus Berkiella sp.]